MTRGRLFIAVRAILIGWAALLPIAFLILNPLLRFAAPVLGAMWIATARLGLNCAGLIATGWLVGCFARPSPALGVLAFAATLTWWDLDSLVGINVPWLFRLTADLLRDSSYLSSFVSTAASHVLLFTSLVAGGLLSRPTAKPPSIVADLQCLSDKIRPKTS